MAKSPDAFPAFLFVLLCTTALCSAAQQFELPPSELPPSPTPSPLPPLPPGEDPDKLQLSLEVLWDGTVTARDKWTKEVRWSFFSGNPLSSAHGPMLDAWGGNSSLGIRGETSIPEDEFVFCGADWNLYAFDKKKGIKVLPIPPHELIQNTPTVLDGAVILGTMTTSVFVLDAKSGSLVHTFDSRNESFRADHLREEDIWRFLDEIVTKPSNANYLFMLRRDYSIKSVSLAERALLWNVSVADIWLHHHINPDNMLRLPGARENRYSRSLQPAPIPAALPGAHEMNVMLSSDERQDFASWLVSLSYKKKMIIAGSVALLCIFILTFIWQRTQRKQTAKKRKPRRARAGAVPPPQETAEVTSCTPPKNIASLQSSLTDLQVPSNDASSEETIIGTLRVTTRQIGFGSNGTIVFEGFLGERQVAVKRMLKQYYDKAQKEINNLIKSDEHPNILRYFHLESDAHFVYVALERCQFSLNDLVLTESAKRLKYNGKECIPGDLSKEEFQSVQEKAGGAEDCQLWDDWDRPSAKLLQLMRDILAGLAHLHSVGIVHRDLKPHNVLISYVRSQAKLCDMGISKQLADGATTIDSCSTSPGSSGWQAPEQLMRETPQTKSMDLFSLGCILFFSISGGYHPFGTRFERDHNILNDRFDLFPIEHVPEAKDLISALLQRDPSRRPHINTVQVHPLFWSSEKRLKFLCDTSDCVEVEDKESKSPILEDLEVASQSALGCSWADKLDAVFLQNLGKYRKYNYNSVRDLLRVIRNKSSHFRELPQEVQQLFGSYPEGFENYFRSKFPRLLLEVFFIMYRHCENEEGFRKYFSDEFTVW